MPGTVSPEDKKLKKCLTYSFTYAIINAVPLIQTEQLFLNQGQKCRIKHQTRKGDSID